MKDIQRRAAALAAAAALLLCGLPAGAAQQTAAAQAAETTIAVATGAELSALSRSCILDTWSRDKTVVLTADIDLHGVDFSPIPTFGGTFLGGGHSISGVDLTVSGGPQGLFRQIQPGASVQDLTVKGTLRCGGAQEGLGLLAGSSAGQILNCRAVGSVTGDTAAGGLVGVNEAGGELVNCRFSGRVSGRYAAGGIAGRNLGSIIGCENSGSINTEEVEDTGRTDYTSLSQFSDLEALPAYSDAGGIAGYSGGGIQSCRSTGPVGREQTGVNVGGIVGRSGGWVDGCENTGAVRGRQDVGGIAGHLQPEVMRSFDQDLLEQLLDRMDRLGAAVEQTLDHGDGAVSALSGDLQALGQQTRTARAAADALGQALTAWVNGNMEQLASLSARIARGLEGAKTVLEDARDAVQRTEELLRALERVRWSLADAAQEGTAAAADFQRAAEAVQRSGEALEAALPAVGSAIERVAAALGSGSASELRQALEDLVTALGGLSDALPSLQAALGHLRAALGHLTALGDDVTAALDRLEGANRAAGAVLSALDTAIADLLALTQELAQGPAYSPVPIGPEVTDPAQALSDSLEGLLQRCEDLGQTLEKWAGVLIDDLRRVNGHLRAMVQLIRQERETVTQAAGQSREALIAAHFQDVSGQGAAPAQSKGRISASENRGAVSGTSAVGGIAGLVGIEADLGAADDLTRLGDYSLAYHYQARALISGCVNAAAVTGKKDAVGGIAGQVDMGLAEQCEHYGDITAQGSYAGGIAGRSAGTIRRCWAKGRITGQRYVGGIAGQAAAAADCRSLVEISGQAYTGAVLGTAGADTVLEGNLFTHDTLGGADGVSYAGRAEGTDFAALQADAPRRFSRMEVTFLAGDTVVAVIPFSYGGGIDALPEIPVKAGHFAAWPDLDYTRLTASCTVQAVYTPYTTALSDGEGELPEVVVSGSFGGRARVAHTVRPISWTDARGRARRAQAVTVTVQDPDFQDISCTVHYRLPRPSGRWQLYVETPEGFEPADSRRDGQYLLFSAPGGSVTFCVTEAEGRLPLPAIAAAGAAALAGTVLILRRRKRPRSGA